MNETERRFIEGAARAMYVQAWADREERTCERCGGEIRDDGYHWHDSDGIKEICKGIGRSFAGQELMDIAPPTPDYARRQAWKLLHGLQSHNPQIGGPLHGSNLEAILCAAYLADGLAPNSGAEPSLSRWERWVDENARLFGHYVAMQALGHGVSWFDDHAEFELHVPSVEFELE